MAKQIVRLDKELDFYRQQSKISSPGRFESLFGNLPTNVSDLCKVVQNLLLHQFWILDEKNYGVTAESLKVSGRNLNDEINLRSVEEKLEFVIGLEDQSLIAAREVDKRAVGNCRDYSVMLVSMLRHQGIPARVRSGVARYLYPDREMLEDHFICEFWNKTEDRWQRVDAQIDEVQRRVLRLTMDMTDLPPNQFLDAGESYYELKSGKVKSDKIGIFEYRGWSYVHNKLMSDLACINSVEVLPWEGWGICERIDNDSLSEKDGTLLEEIAKLLVALSNHSNRFWEAEDLFRTHPDLKIPSDYKPRYNELPFLK